jgi:hypothetical protein
MQGGLTGGELAANATTVTECQIKLVIATNCIEFPLVIVDFVVQLFDSLQSKDVNSTIKWGDDLSRADTDPVSG